MIRSRSPFAIVTLSLALLLAGSQAWAAELSTGGQLRWRLEGRDPAGYSSATALAGDSLVNILRTRFHLAADFGNGLRTFVEGQDSREWGEETSVAADMAGLDLKQGYVELADWLGRSGLTLRVGRQTLDYGSTRLVSSLDWNKVGRSWDGFFVSQDLGGAKLDGFATVVKQGTSLGNDNYFSGLVWHKGGMAAGRDVYFFHQKNTDGSGKREKVAAGQAPTGDLSLATIGGRIAEKRGDLDYKAEAAWQLGDEAGEDVSAFGFDLGAGKTFPWKSFRVGLEYAWATGDEDPTDGEHGSFRPPYPFGHSYNGYVDVFHWRNGGDLFLRLEAKPGAAWWVAADLHRFELAEARDAWYDAGGAAIRKDAAGKSGKDVGTELDLHAKTAVREHLKLWLGYSVFVPGDFVENTPGSDPRTDWFFVQATIDF